MKTQMHDKKWNCGKKRDLIARGMIYKVKRHLHFFSAVVPRNVQSAVISVAATAVSLWIFLSFSAA